jgi:protein tyrosine phosphatase (PTP) superfamily phosphohydrolase (DUF442 family)
MKAGVCLGVLLIFCSAGTQSAMAAESVAASDAQVPPDAGQLLEVAADVTLSGDVDLMEIVHRYPDGVLYIDLRTPAEEGVAYTRDEALRLGMRYEDIPVAGPVIDAGQLAKLEKLRGERSRFQHTVLRCGSGNRAAMMWGAVRVDAGDELDTVLEDLAPIMTKPPVSEALKNYADSDNR